MKKSIFICMVVVFNMFLFSCDKEANNEELQFYETENTMATGGENNDDDPDEEENKPKT